MGKSAKRLWAIDAPPEVRHGRSCRDVTPKPLFFQDLLRTRWAILTSHRRNLFCPLHLMCQPVAITEQLLAPLFLVAESDHRVNFQLILNLLTQSRARRPMTDPVKCTLGIRAAPTDLACANRLPGSNISKWLLPKSCGRRAHTGIWFVIRPARSCGRARSGACLGDRIDGWRVCWLGGWDRARRTGARGVRCDVDAGGLDLADAPAD